MLQLLNQFAAWITRGGCMIIDKDSHRIPLVLNRAQFLIMQAMYRQAEAGLPLRICILKSRQQGISTFCMAWFTYVTMVKDNTHAFSMSHRLSELKTKFNDVPITLMHDAGAPLITENTQELKLENGSSYRVGSSKSDYAGSGVTYQFVHITEASKYPRKGMHNVTSVINTLLYSPNTCVIFESTAHGMDPIHYQLFKDASTIPNHQYTPIFTPWFFQDEYATKTEPLIRTDEENLMASQAEQYDITLTDEQLAYRRAKALEPNANINQEFPTTAEQAVEHSEGLIYKGLHLCLINELPDVDWDETMCFGGYDAGWSDNCCVLSVYYYRNICYIYDVFAGSEVYLKNQAAVFHPGTYYSDPGAKIERAELRTHLPSTTRLVSSPRRMVTGVSGKGSYVMGEIRLVQECIRDGRLKILRSCSGALIEEALNYFTNEATGLPIERRIDNSHMDIMDAMRYALCGILRKPNPTTYGGASSKHQRTPSRRDQWRAI